MLAGVHDPRGGSAAARPLLEAALSGAAVLGDERFTVAVQRTPSPPGGPILSEDPAAAREPLDLVSEAGGRLCALDGALYGLDALARAEGLDPSSPPARVVLELWRRRGEGLLPLLRGDFVVVLWDGDARAGLVARDQMGGRGLVWHAAGGRVSFASEVRPLLHLVPRRPGPDHASVAHWLAVSGLPEDRTLYEGVRRLPAGHLLQLSADDVALRPFWTPIYRRPLRAPRAELVDRLRAGLTTAVARRSVGGGVTGVMLSGGLDSSTVAALAARTVAPERAPARAYSAVFPRHPTIDESALIDELGKSLGLSTTRAEVRQGSVLSGALAYLDAWQLPPISPNLFFWIPLLRRAAADGIRVMLDGEGGDELFGLSIHLLSDRLRRARLVSALRLTRRAPLSAGPSWRASRRLLVRYGLRGAAPPAAHRVSRRLRGEASYAPEWFRPDAARALLAVDEPARWKRLDGPRWWAGLVDAVVNGMGPALGYDHLRRRGAMAGIESRHPLVDVDVIELVLQLPPELAFHPDHTRPLQRECVAGLVPDSIRLRPTKSSFDALFHESLAGPDLPAVRSLLGTDDAEIGAYVDLPAFRRALLDPAPPTDPRTRQGWALRVWRATTAECWLREQSEPGFGRNLREGGELAVTDLLLNPATA